MPQSFADVDLFYRRRGGERSPEWDYGVNWMRGMDRFRVSWVKDTGDIYVTNLRTGSIQVLATIESSDEVERVLDGWAYVCGGRESLDWVYAQLAGVGVA